MAENLVQRLKSSVTSATLALASLISSSTNAADYITIQRGFFGIHTKVTHVQTQPAIVYAPRTVLTYDVCGRPMYAAILMPVQTEVITNVQVIHQPPCFVPGIIHSRIIPLPQNYCVPVWQQPFTPTVIYSQPAVVVQAQQVPHVTPAPIQKSPMQAPFPSPVQVPIQRLPEPIQAPTPQLLQPLQNPRQVPQIQMQQKKYLSPSLMTVQPNPHGWRNAK